MAYPAPILVVDDSPAELALDILRRAAWPANDIRVARDAEEALDFLFWRDSRADDSFPEPPLIILLDIKLSKLDGPGILWALKADERTQSIPVIVMTSSRQETDFLQQSGLNADGRLKKPLTSGALAEVIRRHLQLVPAGRHDA